MLHSFKLNIRKLIAFKNSLDQGMNFFLRKVPLNHSFKKFLRSQKGLSTLFVQSSLKKKL